MTARSKAQLHATAAGSAPPTARRWLLQLPSTSSNLRVRTWRRLQQLGALPVRQAVYVLPDSPSTREDFECENYLCQLPTADLGIAVQLLDGTWKPGSSR